MTMRVIEGFDYFGNIADVGQKYATVTGLVNSTAGVQRYGVGKCMGGNSSSVAFVLDAQATWVVGDAFYFAPAAAGNYIWLYDGANPHTNAYQNADGTISIRRNTTVLATTVAALAAGWHFWEFKCLIDDAAGAGTVVLKVDGAVLYTNPGALDTRNAGNASATTVIVRCAGSGNYFDDVYIMDGVDATATQGAPYNDFIGDHRIVCAIATGAGNYTQGTPSSGTIASCIDEVTPDADTTYVSMANGEKFTVNVTDITGLVAIPLCYSIESLSRKDDAGTVTQRIVERENATDRTYTATNEGDSYAYKTSGPQFKMPDTTAVSLANLDGLEIGVERTA